MKKIKSIYVREIGVIKGNEVETVDGILITHLPIICNTETNTYHQGNTEYKGEHIISVTYE